MIVYIVLQLVELHQSLIETPSAFSLPSFKRHIFEILINAK